MTTAIQKSEEKAVEFVPYGEQDKIKLTISIVQKLIAVPTKSGRTCSERDALKFIMLCRARKLNAFSGDAFLLGYDGKDGPQFSLITAHQALLKRAELHPEFDGMKSGVIVEEDGKVIEMEGDFRTENQTLLGGWATVFFKTRKIPSHDRLALKNYIKRFPDGSPMGRWKDDPEGLIVKCSESSALRKAFPTMLAGLYTQQEIDVKGSSLSEVPLPPLDQIENGNGSGEHPAEDNSNPDLAPQRTSGTAKPGAESQDSPQAALATLAQENGLTIDDYQKWGDETGNDTDARSRTSWDEIPKEVAVRLLRNKVGFIKQMKTVKGVA